MMLYFLIYTLFTKSVYSKIVNNNCSNITLQTNPKINLTEYIKHTWFIQQQQITGYQPIDSLFCVTATYNIDNYSHVPFFTGKVLSVYNYANNGKINGPNIHSNRPLCARQTNWSEPEKLYVSPCFLPNLFSGPYWIIAAGPKSYNYSWAVVGGGIPSVKMSNNTCGYKLDGFKNSGLWIFSRQRIMKNTTLYNLRYFLKKKHIDTRNLIDVPQRNCQYKDAFIK